MKCVAKPLRSSQIAAVLVVIAIFGGICHFYAWAGEPPSDQASPTTQASPAPQDAPRTPVKKKVKGKQRNSEKDADGTEAYHQFQENTVIKSQYKLNGQPLEVDPD
jgi:hypothetical protein